MSGRCRIRRRDGRITGFGAMMLDAGRFLPIAAILCGAALAVIADARPGPSGGA